MLRFTKITVASLLAQDVVFVAWCFQSNQTQIDANPSLPIVERLQMMSA